MVRRTILLALLLLAVPLLVQAGPPPPVWLWDCSGYGFAASVMALDRDRGTPRAEMLTWIRGWFTSRPVDRVGLRLYTDLANAVYAQPHVAPATIQDDAERFCLTERFLPASRGR